MQILYVFFVVSDQVDNGYHKTFYQLNHFCLILQWNLMQSKEYAKHVLPQLRHPDLQKKQQNQCMIVTKLSQIIPGCGRELFLLLSQYVLY